MIGISTKTKQLTLLFVCLCSLMLSYNAKAQNCTVLFASSVNNYDVTFAPDTFINGAETIWDYGDGSPADTNVFGNHTYLTADTFVVCLTINDTANLCTSTVCDSIIVLPPTCNSTFSYNNETFFAEGQNGGTGFEEFVWNYGDASASDTGMFVTHTYAAPGTYYVCLTTNDTSINCSSIVCDSVVILPPDCEAGFNNNGNIFFAQSTTGNNNLNFIWDFGDGSPADSGQFIQHIFSAAGSYTVCLTSTDTSINCSSVFCDTVVIDPFCTSTFTYNNGNFNAQNTGGSQNPMTYIWDFGDSSSTDTGQFVQHQFPQAGTYYACLTAIDSIANCTSVFCDSVIVEPTCASTFNYVGGFFIAQNNGGNTGIDYTWDFGDTTSGAGQFVQHNFAAPGTYLVCLTATDSSTNCVSVYCDSVVITVVGCDASFTYADSLGSVSFNGSTTATGFVITYNWDFGDGQTGNGQNPTHDYFAAGTYTVCVTANDFFSGCSDTMCQTITITTPVIPVCNSTINVAGNTDGAVSLTAQPFSLTNVYGWDFGDGSTGTGVIVQHTYAASGTYNVCLNTTNPTNGCTSQTCTTLVVVVPVISPCEASYTYTDDGTGSFSFTGATAATGFGLSYVWDFGDAGTGNTQNPTHVYTASGDYIVCFTVNKFFPACTDSICQTVTVEFTGIQKLSIDAASIIMAPNPVKDNLTLSYTLNNNAKVSIEIYNVLGKEILNISEPNQAFGQHNNTINLSGIAAGSYILKLNVDGNVINRKMIKE